MQLLSPSLRHLLGRLLLRWAARLLLPGSSPGPRRRPAPMRARAFPGPAAPAVLPDPDPAPNAPPSVAARVSQPPERVTPRNVLARALAAARGVADGVIAGRERPRSEAAAPASATRRRVTHTMAGMPTVVDTHVANGAPPDVDHETKAVVKAAQRGTQARAPTTATATATATATGEPIARPGATSQAARLEPASRRPRWVRVDAPDRNTPARADARIATHEARAQRTPPRPVPAAPPAVVDTPAIVRRPEPAPVRRLFRERAASEASDVAPHGTRRDRPAPRVFQIERERERRAVEPPAIASVPSPAVWPRLPDEAEAPMQIDTPAREPRWPRLPDAPTRDPRHERERATRRAQLLRREQRGESWSE